MSQGTDKHLGNHSDSAPGSVGQTRAVFSPHIDLLTSGALSIITIAAVLVVGPQFFIDANFAQLIVLSTLINGAHFAASYRMLYYSKQQALRYPQASIAIPGLLVAYAIWALYAASSGEPEGGFWIQALLVAVAYYLALHYTGQAWGMMSSYAFVDGVRFTAAERMAFRVGLKFLMFWQIIWATHLVLDLPDYLVAALPTLTKISHALAGVALVMGLWASFSISSRTKGFPPPKVLAPYFALFFWYALLYKVPGSLVLVQFFHAIQYLIFPVRVELNRTTILSNLRRPLNANRHLLEYLLSLVIVAATIFLLMPYIINSWGTGYSPYVTVLVALINIHHFYIDGAIWKIGTPTVKEELFAHLK